MNKEPLRSERTSAGPLSDADREARIEQLLLSGLDQYFTGHYEQAINIWTRVAFLERGHGRARAYIERARSALAERQRETEELVHGGVAAYNAGDIDTARDLLNRAVEQGGNSDTALLFLERLNRLEVTAGSVPTSAPGEPAVRSDESPGSRRSSWLMTTLVSAGVAAGILVPVIPVSSWLAELPIDSPAAVAPVVDPLPVVLPSDRALARARELQRAGQLRDALRTLERIDATDPRRSQADALRADVQRALLGGLDSRPGVTP